MGIRSFVFALAVSPVLLCGGAHARQGAPASVPPAAVVDLETVTVSGVQPGPGLWRVSKGERELWLLGSLYPLPAKATWDSSVARAKVAESQLVILAPLFTIDTETGFFRSTYLGFKLYQATKNPDGATLGDVLPADLYARWREAKARYLPRDDGVERKRPLLAADELFDAATKRSGLSTKQVVVPEIEDAAKDHGVRIIQPRVTVVIKDPKEALKEARATTLADNECLVATLDAIEQDLPRMVENANAWSVGDVGAVRFEQIERRGRACADAFSGSDIVKKRGVPDVRASSRAKWIEAAETALATNAVTFSVVPLQDIVGPGGYAATLAEKGYVVEAP